MIIENQEIINLATAFLKNMSKLPAPEHFINQAKKMGVKEAKIISPKQIFTSEWVYWKCKFGCGGYGERLTCPPNSPKPKETRDILDGYKTAILLHTPSEYECLKDMVVELEHEAFLSGYYKAFSMGSGPCHLCDECDTESLCNHPREARPSMEACGIDVFKTARTAGYPIEVVKNHTCPQNYYALLLLE